MVIQKPEKQKQYGWLYINSIPMLKKQKSFISYDSFENLVLLIPTFSTLTSFSCIYKYLLQLSFVQNNRSLHIISLCRKRFPRKWSQKTKTLWRILTVVLLQFSKLNIFQEDRNNFACISNFFSYHSISG